MPTSRSVFYRDDTYYPALVAMIEGSTRSVLVVMFLFRNDYEGDARPRHSPCQIPPLLIE